MEILSKKQKLSNDVEGGGEVVIVTGRGFGETERNLRLERAERRSRELGLPAHFLTPIRELLNAINTSLDRPIAGFRGVWKAIQIATTEYVTATHDTTLSAVERRLSLPHVKAVFAPFARTGLSFISTPFGWVPTEPFKNLVIALPSIEAVKTTVRGVLEGRKHSRELLVTFKQLKPSSPSEAQQAAGALIQIVQGELEEVGLFSRATEQTTDALILVLRSETEELEGVTPEVRETLILKITNNATILEREKGLMIKIAIAARTADIIDEKTQNEIVTFLESSREVNTIVPAAVSTRLASRESAWDTRTLNQIAEALATECGLRHAYRNIFETAPRVLKQQQQLEALALEKEQMREAAAEIERQQPHIAFLTEKSLQDIDTLKAQIGGILDKRQEETTFIATTGDEETRAKLDAIVAEVIKQRGLDEEVPMIKSEDSAAGLFATVRTLVELTRSLPHSRATARLFNDQILQLREQFAPLLEIVRLTKKEIGRGRVLTEETYTRLEQILVAALPQEMVHPMMEFIRNASTQRELFEHNRQQFLEALAVGCIPFLFLDRRLGNQFVMMMIDLFAETPAQRRQYLSIINSFIIETIGITLGGGLIGALGNAISGGFGGGNPFSNDAEKRDKFWAGYITDNLRNTGRVIIWTQVLAGMFNLLLALSEVGPFQHIWYLQTLREHVVSLGWQERHKIAIQMVPFLVFGAWFPWVRKFGLLKFVTKIFPFLDGIRKQLPESFELGPVGFTVDNQMPADAMQAWNISAESANETSPGVHPPQVGFGKDKRTLFLVRGFSIGGTIAGPELETWSPWSASPPSPAGTVFSRYFPLWQGKATISADTWYEQLEPSLLGRIGGIGRILVEALNLLDWEQKNEKSLRAGNGIITVARPPQSPLSLAIVRFYTNTVGRGDYGRAYDWARITLMGAPWGLLINRKQIAQEVSNIEDYRYRMRGGTTADNVGVVFRLDPSVKQPVQVPRTGYISQFRENQAAVINLALTWWVFSLTSTGRSVFASEPLQSVVRGWSEIFDIGRFTLTGQLPRVIDTEVIDTSIPNLQWDLDQNKRYGFTYLATDQATGKIYGSNTPGDPNPTLVFTP